VTASQGALNPTLRHLEERIESKNGAANLLAAANRLNRSIIRQRG
jgi:hypothetical protein